MPLQRKVKNQVNNHRQTRRATILVAALVLLIFYVIAPQLKYFRNSLDTIVNADYALVILGLFFVAGTYLAAAGTYWFISYIRLRYWQTVLIQVADGFTNRLLPAGAGAIATNIAYLSRRHKSRVKAGLVVGANDIIGFLGHISLLIAMLFLYGVTGSPITSLKFSSILWPAVITAAVIIFVAIVIKSRFRGALARGLKSINTVAGFVLRHPKRLAAAFGCSVLVTVGYGMVLYMVMLALNVHLSFLQAFLVLTASILAMTITPTPGGLGGAEAGIVAAQISLGVSSDQALSVALVYRGLTYWLPLAPGLIALRIALKRGYLGN